MRISIVSRHEITSDGSRVWVNGPDGASVARYHPIAGRDVHKPLAEQSASCSPCLDCSKDTSWEAFVDSVKQNCGVKIPEKHRPRQPRRERGE